MKHTAHIHISPLFSVMLFIGFFKAGSNEASLMHLVVMCLSFFSSKTVPLLFKKKTSFFFRAFLGLQQNYKEGIATFFVGTISYLTSVNTFPNILASSISLH